MNDGQDDLPPQVGEDEVWDVQGTCARAGLLFGRDAKSQSSASLQSVFQRFAHAKFHLGEIARLKDELAQHVLQRPAPGVTRHELVQTFLTKAEAHALGAVQSLHAIPDLFAFGVFYATGLHQAPSPLAERDVTHSKVVGQLQRSATFSSLGAQLNRLTQAKNWPVLNGLSNLAKHRSIVRPYLSQDMTGKRPEEYELRFQAGKYGSVAWDEASITELLYPLHDELDAAVISLGLQLSGTLAVCPVGP